MTTNFFRVIGGSIVAGRDFQDQDGLPQPAPAAGTPAPGTPAAPQLPFMAILSHEYFERRFGGDTSILGRPMVAGGGQPAPIVIGVLAPDFHLYFPPEANEEAEPDIWVANRLDYDSANRNQFGIRPIARLNPGVTIEQAQHAADVVAAETRKQFVISGTAGYFIDLEPLGQISWQMSVRLLWR